MVFIRCIWYPEENQELDSRIEEVGALLSRPEVVKIIGIQPYWYDGGYSKKEALSSPRNLNTLADRKAWYRTNIFDNWKTWDFGVWNGHDDIENEMGISATLNTPVDPENMNGHDIILINMQFEFIVKRSLQWQDFLDCAELLANELGGCAIINSDRADEIIEKHYGEDDQKHYFRSAAHAVFWGEDRNGGNPEYAGLHRRNIEPPFSMIACKDWDEFLNPDEGKLVEIIEMYE